MNILHRRKRTVVPARAGMSPVRIRLEIRKWRGPRASGDEPWATRLVGAVVVWSPRERG